MESQSNKIPILIVGAMSTGMGKSITKHCLQQPSLLVNIMDSDPRMDKELSSMIEKSGGKLITSDLSKPENLKEITKGIHTVISTISLSDERTAVDGQLALIKASMESGVKRIIPSDFSLNYRNLERDQIMSVPALRSICSLNEKLSSMKVPILRIQGGILVENMLRILQKEETLGCWGDSNMKHSMTCYEDMGKFVASVIKDKERLGDLVFVCHHNSISEIIDAYNKVRGTKLETKKLGSLEDLKKKSEEKRKSGDMQGAELMSLLTVISNPKSNFEKTNNNLVPELKPMSLEDIIKNHPEIKLE